MDDPKAMLDSAERLLSADYMPVREVLEYVYRIGVLDGQLKMSRRAQALVNGEAAIDHAQKVWR